MTPLFTLIAKSLWNQSESGFYRYNCSESKGLAIVIPMTNDSNGLSGLCGELIELEIFNTGIETAEKRPNKSRETVEKIGLQEIGLQKGNG